MIGAIIGDIVGSRFEFHNHKSKEFSLFDKKCKPTDDSVMTLAVAEAILESKDDFSDLPEEAVRCMQHMGRMYPNAGYGGYFFEWIFAEKPEPYHSYGDGAGMRVSPCGFAAGSIDEAKQLSDLVTKVTHNHPEGMKGAEAVSSAVYMARTGSSKGEIKDYITACYYDIDFTIDGIRPTYGFDVSCQGTVPVAIEAFFESENFEDAIRNAISVGGDSDTIGAMTGAIAEAYYGVPKDIADRTLDYLDDRQKEILLTFEEKYPSKITDSKGKIIGTVADVLRGHGD